MRKLQNYIAGNWVEGDGEGQPLYDAVTGDIVALKQSKAMLSYTCECVPGAFFFTKGWIEGEKIDENSWQVRASLTSPLSPSTVFVFSGVFRN